MALRILVVKIKLDMGSTDVVTHFVINIQNFLSVELKIEKEEDKGFNIACLEVPAFLICEEEIQV